MSVWILTVVLNIHDSTPPQHFIVIGDNQACVQKMIGWLDNAYAWCDRNKLSRELPVATCEPAEPMTDNPKNL